MKSIALLCVFAFVGSLTAWAVCAQASPTDCPNYMLVACHDDATQTQTMSGPDYAYAGVMDDQLNILSEQDGFCGDINAMDPTCYDFTKCEPGWPGGDEPWWDPNLY